MSPLLANQPRPTPGAVTDDVALAQRGDMQAFERIYQQHAGRVNALCRRLAVDVARADELMQDVFVRAWEKLESFRGESSLDSWLHRVTVNVFLASDRTDKRRRAHEDTVDDDHYALSAATAPVDVGGRIDLERAIATLPPGARMAFVMHDVEGYSHEEIAAMSGIAAATVRVQLHRARRHLMEALG
ncbi:MAG: RNA polymerase sigma factor [Gemmatimonas sp.]